MMQALNEMVKTLQELRQRKLESVSLFFAEKKKSLEQKQRKIEESKKN